MNEEIKKNSKLLREILLKEPLIVEYSSLKKEIENNEKLNQKIREMNYYKNCNANTDDNFLSKKIYSDIVSDPVISNYFSITEEVEDLLDTVKKELI